MLRSAAARVWLSAAPLVAGAVLAASTSGPVHAQRATAAGAISGRATFPTGDAAAAAEVTVERVDGGDRRQGVTDDDGRFRIDELPPGTYRVDVVVADLAQATQLVTLPRDGASADLAIELAFLGEIIEVTDPVRTRGEQLEGSAEAVDVVETREAKRRTADFGEVLARTSGVGVRRGGGLGSGTRFSLAGLTDDQVRFFLDGVPLDLAGYPFGLANVPVNLVERAEVYRGVVPIRFGADALGGAVNLVSADDVSPSRRAVSYQAGSFGTHRLTLGATERHGPTGLFARVGGFFDRADNRYPVDVLVPSQDPATRGQAVPARLDRFHDDYLAGGGSVELGVASRPWADRLSVRGFVGAFARDLQSNPTMTTPYGDVRFDEATAGGMARYQHHLRAAVSVDVVAGYARTRTDFLDVGQCIYDWFGDCVRDRQAPGELDEGNPRDDTLWEDAGYGRVVVGWQVRPAHALRASVAPTYVVRDGVERLRSDSNNYGAISADRDLATLVAGVEYEVDVLDDRIEHVAFVKAYAQWVRSTTGVAGTFVDRTLSRATRTVGAGDALRVRVADGFLVKASYEYATRLPDPDEVFGDAVLTNENLELRPEVSHNANLGAAVDRRDTASGSWRGEVNGFVRAADDLIVLLTAYGQRFRNENVFAARSIGVEASAGWTSPGQHVVLDGNVTYQDFRNVRAEGLFAEFDGDRIPNRPYLFCNAAAQVQLADLATARDRLALGWHTRYVHEFFQYWESAGTADSKLTIPSQLLHALALTYVVERERVVTVTVEVDNLTDARAFDFYGAQRPGRAVYLKTTAEF